MEKEKKSAKEKAALKAAKAALKAAAKNKTVEAPVQPVVAAPVHHTPLPTRAPVVPATPGAIEKQTLSHEAEALAAMKKNGIKHG